MTIADRSSDYLYFGKPPPPSEESGVTCLSLRQELQAMRAGLSIDKNRESHVATGGSSCVMRRMPLSIMQGNTATGRAQSSVA